MTPASGLTGAVTARAGEVVKAWKRDRSARLNCLACDEGELTITDASVMPYAEWYLLDCGRCGHRTVYHHMINRPRFAEEP